MAADTGAAAHHHTTVAVAATLAPVDGPRCCSRQSPELAAGTTSTRLRPSTVSSPRTIDGDRLPDGARLTISNDAGLVSYIFTVDGVYLMPEGGEWEADDSDPPAVDPINALSAPTSVTVVSNDGTTVQLVVTVPLASLGIPGEGDVPLQVAIVDGALSTITYSTTTPDGKVAAATTTIGPPVDPSPVVSPI